MPISYTSEPPFPSSRLPLERGSATNTPVTPTPDNLERSTGRNLALLALLVGAVAIAFAGIFAKLSMNAGYLGPLTSAFWRFALAMPFILLAMLLTKPSKPRDLTAKLINPLWLLLPGLLFAGDMAFFHTSFTFTTVSNGTLLANLQVFIVGFLAWWLLKERFNSLFLLGVIVAFAGIWLLVINDETKEYASNPTLGNIFAVGTAFWYASYFLIIKWLRRDFRALEIMTVTTMVATVILFLAVILIPQDREHLIPYYNESMPGEYTKAWIYLILLAVVPQCIGQGCIVWSLSRLPASFTAVVLLLQPVFAGFLGWIILAEALNNWQIAASVVVLVGILLAKLGTPSR